MLQAALLDCLLLDLFPFPQNCFVPSEVDVSGCDVVQALVVPLVVVVFDKGPDLAFEVTGQVVIFQQNAVFHGLVPSRQRRVYSTTLDLALSLRMERCATHVRHILSFQPFGQIARDVAGPVIT